MAKLHCVVLALLAMAAVALGATGRTLTQVPSPTDIEPAYPYGWWQSILAGDAWCNLRHFPPLPEGRGVCNILCKPGQAYNHEFLYRLVPTGNRVSLEGASNVSTGTQYHLRVFNLMQSYSLLDTNRGANVVIAGHNRTRASTFLVEKLSGASGRVDLSTEFFRLKVPSGRYCRVKGSGNSALLYCDLAASSSRSATQFQMAYNSFWGVTFTNVALNTACGGMQIQDNLNIPNYVNCTVPTANLAGNYKTMFALGLKQPGAPALTSGMSVAIKYYDNLYRYMLSSFVASGTAPYAVTFEMDQATNAGQWMVISKLRGAAGEEIQRGDVVTIKNERLNAYCGAGPSPATTIMCNKAVLASTDTRYHFVINW